MEEIVIAARSDPKSLIFLFHGYGSDNDNLLPVGERFSEAIPSAEVHLPNGIAVCREGVGRQWFSMESDNANVWKRELEANASQIMNYVDSVKDSHHLEYKDVIFAGFSQGAMVSLSLGTFHDIKAVISFAGVLLSPEEYIQKRQTKVLLAHGNDDIVIPVSAAKSTAEILMRADINVELAVSDGLGHAIDNYLLSKAVDFLRSL